MADQKYMRMFGRILIISLFLLLGMSITSCDRNSLLFSDDFESYPEGSVPALPWERSGDGKAVIDSSKSVSGKHSVHFISGEGYKNRSILTFSGKDVFPLKKNRYYGQMQMYVDSASPDVVHWTMIESSGKVPGKDFRAEIRYGGQHSKRLMANYETNGVKSDCWQHSSVQIPEKRWFRVNWFFDGRRNEMKLWIDGRSIDEITVRGRGQGCLGNDLNGEWQFPIFENVQIGWVDYQPNGGERNVWIDDFAISSKPFKN